MSAIRIGEAPPAVFVPWAKDIRDAYLYWQESKVERNAHPGYRSALKEQICRNRYHEMKQLGVINGELACG